MGYIIEWNKGYRQNVNYGSNKEGKAIYTTAVITEGNGEDSKIKMFTTRREADIYLNSDLKRRFTKGNANIAKQLSIVEVF